MSTRQQKVPGPDHPIAIAANPRRVVIAAAGRTLVDTRHAFVLREASYPPVQYVPRADADMSRLTRSTHTTYCPYKGDCSYYSIPELGGRGANAVWTYEAPFAAVAEIGGYLAFYADRVEISEQA